jgi:hypothetical protein
MPQFFRSFALYFACATSAYAQPAVVLEPISLSHHSSFTDYKKLTDLPLQPWRLSNDTVLKVGGWRAYAREINAPKTTAEPEVKKVLKP